MVKKRIFIVNDSSFLNTGYSIYGREILSRLHASDKFEVAELGCYADVSNPIIKSIPWKFYPNAVQSTDQRSSQYGSNALNQFGLWRFNRCVVDFKPHIVFDIRDYWMFAYQETSPLRPYFNWIIMPATDSAPPRQEWLYTFSNADMVMPYTEWARKTLLESCGNQINLFPKIANAGINPNEFYPLPNKKQLQHKHFGKDVSVIGTVMRNQKRKLYPDLMVAFKKYLEALKLSNNNDLFDRTILYLHTSYPEENGWDLPALLLEYGIADKTYITYHCKNCKEYFPSKFQQGLTTCKYCHNKSAIVASPVNGISTNQLNEIYNTFDLFVQYAICEGFGMPQVEAAACGVPIASVDYSAMTEIADNLSGYKIPLARVFREMETNADRVYPDIDKTSQIFYDFFVNKSEEEKATLSKTTRQKCIEIYTWDNVYKVWEECFDSIDISKKQAWEDLKYAEPKHLNFKVPANLTDKEFIQFICLNIINDPYLLNTATVQTLIKDAANGLVSRNNSITMLNKQMIIERLEGHLNNKIACEKMRTDINSMPKEDFIL